MRSGEVFSWLDRVRQACQRPPRRSQAVSIGVRITFAQPIPPRMSCGPQSPRAVLAGGDLARASQGLEIEQEGARTMSLLFSRLERARLIDRIAAMSTSLEPFESQED
jgi:hypothetical protein